jgi:hypothetical protein
MYFVYKFVITKSKMPTAHLAQQANVNARRGMSEEDHVCGNAGPAPRYYLSSSTMHITVR